jgi:hypothetical protein
MKKELEISINILDINHKPKFTIGLLLVYATALLATALAPIVYMPFSLIWVVTITTIILYSFVNMRIRLISNESEYTFAKTRAFLYGWRQGLLIAIGIGTVSIAICVLYWLYTMEFAMACMFQAFLVSIMYGCLLHANGILVIRTVWRAKED